MLLDGGQFLRGHQEAAVAGQADHLPVWVAQLRRNGGGHAVTHGAAGGRKLGPRMSEAVIAMRPGAVITRAVGEYGARIQLLAQGNDDAGGVHAQFGRRRLRVAQVALPQPIEPAAPRGRVQGIESGGHIGEGVQARLYLQGRLVHAAQLFGAGQHMDQRLPGHGGLQQGIAAGHHFAQPGTHRKDHVGVAHGVGQFGIHAYAHFAHVLRMMVVEQVLAAEGARHGQAVQAGVVLQAVQARAGPARTAHDHQGPSRAGQQGAHAGQRIRRRVGVGHLDRPASLRKGRFGQHVLGQRQHDGAGPARHRHREGAVHVFGDARGAVDLRHPLAELPEHAAVVDFLKRFALDHVVAHLAHQHDKRRGILKRRLHADAGVGSAGPARNHADAWPPRQLAVGFGHERGCALVAARHQADPFLFRVERIQDVQIAFTGNAENGVHAVFQQRPHHMLAACHQFWSVVHRSFNQAA
ncbi:hypothetical protein D3C86_1234780 [compost metagenome]